MVGWLGEVVDGGMAGGWLGEGVCGMCGGGGEWVGG